MTDTIISKAMFYLLLSCAYFNKTSTHGSKKSTITTTKSAQAIDDDLVKKTLTFLLFISHLLKNFPKADYLREAFSCFEILVGIKKESKVKEKEVCKRKANNDTTWVYSTGIICRIHC